MFELTNTIRSPLTQVTILDTLKSGHMVLAQIHVHAHTKSTPKIRKPQ